MKKLAIIISYLLPIFIREKIAILFSLTLGKGFDFNSLKKEVNLFKNLLKKKELFLDIGANKGKYSDVLINYFPEAQIYIFELVLKDKLNNDNIIRHIIKSNQGNIVSDEDNIKYELIEKYKLTVIDVNYPDKIILVEEPLDHTLTMNTFYNNNIYLEISQSINKLLCFNYKINNLS